MVVGFETEGQGIIFKSKKNLQVFYLPLLERLPPQIRKCGQQMRYAVA